MDYMKKKNMRKSNVQRKV